MFPEYKINIYQNEKAITMVYIVMLFLIIIINFIFEARHWAQNRTPFHWSYASAILHMQSVFKVFHFSYLYAGLCQGGHGGGGVDAGHRHLALPGVGAIPFAKTQTENWGPPAQNVAAEILFVSSRYDINVSEALILLLPGRKCTHRCFPQLSAAVWVSSWV